MIWGYALVWMSQYLQRDPDPLMAKLKFLVDYGLRATGIGAGELARLSDEKRDQIGQYIADHDLTLTLRPHVDYLNADLDLVKRQIDDALIQIDRYRALAKTRLIATGVASSHRFMRNPSLLEQMERLVEVMPALVNGVHALGLPFGIENHGDYYVSDLVELCGQVPHLGIFLDTGNTFLIGEAPLPAFHAAAPYVVGGHFKDHHVQPRPEARPLHFEVAPSIIGDGDVPLRQCYEILKAKTPNVENIVMEIELIPPGDIDPLETLERSLAFIRSLEAAS